MIVSACRSSSDSRKVPRYVLDYVMYHELLRIKHGIGYSEGKRRAHTKAFREDERKFARYNQARDWLRSLEI